MHRKLTQEEIEILKANCCQADSWENIDVDPEFDPRWCSNVIFSGRIALGKFNRVITNKSGISTHTGIYNARIHNVEIGDNTLIRGINNYLANYKIGSDCIIENIDSLATEKRCSFGNGTNVPVLNEKGGRNIRIYDNLSAQIAYILVFYRHLEVIQERINALIDSYIETVTSDIGTIGNGVIIKNSREIINTCIGDGAKIRAVERIRNATIISSKRAPVVIRNGVIADNVIIRESSTIIDGAMLSNCFVGEGAEIGKQYSAENSIFFANFIGHHGEAFSLFAGPHTATHHKATLLISAYLSFFNAGSGSNQSNHMYKLGPIHQGIMGRGSKTASDSYVLWPAKIGDFTLVHGRHKSNCDTSPFPYSFLLESPEGGSTLIPGVNLKSVGTIRDADKWIERDIREGERVDIINYDLLTPYSVGKMEQGLIILEDLLDDTRYSQRVYSYNGAEIPRDSLEKGISYYRMGCIKYWGNILVKRLMENPIGNQRELRKTLCYSKDIGCGQWIDMAGLILPKEALQKIISSIESGELNSLNEIIASFNEVNSNYNDYAWNWCARKIEEHLKKPLLSLTRKELHKFIQEWHQQVLLLDTLLIEDASKEFTRSAQMGFGMDGTDLDRISDFIAVRGTFETNDFVNRIKNHQHNKTELYTAVSQRLLQPEVPERTFSDEI